MSGVSPSQEGAGADEMAYIQNYSLQTQRHVCIGVQKMNSEGCITIIVFGVDGEAELVDEELADVGAARARGEVERGALVGVPHGGGDGGGPRALLVERRDEACK